MAVESAVNASTGLIAIGAGLAIGLTAIAAGWAEKAIGTAAIGAMAEKEELFGKGLILTVIPETIVIFGLVVAILIIGIFSLGTYFGMVGLAYSLVISDSSRALILYMISLNEKRKIHS